MLVSCWLNLLGLHVPTKALEGKQKKSKNLQGAVISAALWISHHKQCTVGNCWQPAIKALQRL